ncbi:lipid-A-disaccharide synthase N-terminal domain-containing protein [Ancylobacter amanitiformis]|uniref:Lipid-A-disaccharide synthase-like uncharacterized protein n=1 Tax=Ancylobacter amanitiformis TaxID=217069 RepID=A0ABU0LKP1_9HYPH|nr:lipid-A-disaccharide synthase N-terminal domain-containing protein [Ancylobacter amanitiformis]MDQ0509262.1 lipid-A-disaccharide synthase-like uncharacterized protein [Ancylobacter amanitiformis]
MTASIWMAFGLMGQALFSGRFLLQWWSSEKLGRSVVPNGFWYLSIAGSLSLLAYAIYVRDPVFIVGQSAGFIIYARNLRLIRNERRMAGDAST